MAKQPSRLMQTIKEGDAQQVTIFDDMFYAAINWTNAEYCTANHHGFVQMYV